MTRTSIWLAITLLIAAVTASLLQGVGAAVAVAYGVGVSLVNVLMLAARARQARRLPDPLPPPMPEAGPGAADAEALRTGVRLVPMHLLAFSAVERLLMVALMMALGFTVLALAPVPLMIGFVVGQVVLILGGATAKLESPRGTLRN